MRRISAPRPSAAVAAASTSLGAISVRHRRSSSDQPAWPGRLSARNQPSRSAISIVPFNPGEPVTSEKAAQASPASAASITQPGASCCARLPSDVSRTVTSLGSSSGAFVSSCATMRTRCPRHMERRRGSRPSQRTVASGNAAGKAQTPVARNVSPAACAFMKSISAQASPSLSRSPKAGIDGVPLRSCMPCMTCQSRSPSARRQRSGPARFGGDIDRASADAPCPRPSVP